MPLTVPLALSHKFECFFDTDGLEVDGVVEFVREEQVPLSSWHVRFVAHLHIGKGLSQQLPPSFEVYFVECPARLIVHALEPDLNDGVALLVVLI